MAVLLWKKWEKGRGSGGWGGDRQRNRQVNAQALPKLPFSKLPFSQATKSRGLLGDNKRDEPPFLAPSGPTF